MATSGSSKKSLAVLPALTARVGPAGAVTLTQKFIDGMLEYLDSWDGPARVYMEPSAERSWNLDEIEVDPARLPFQVEVLPFDSPRLGEALTAHAVVLGCLSHRQVHLAGLCRALGVPLVYVSEVSLRTRWQMVRADTPQLPARLWQMGWHFNLERRYRRATRLAAGIQCNGTPTFEAYRALNPRPLLFFDTRMSEEMLATDRELEERSASLLQGGPIRLLFSGRLAPIKGVDDLVPFALELRRLGVPFDFTICGSGPLEDDLRKAIDRAGLGQCMRLTGTLDFKTELTPLTKRAADLFVCCHRQGDPSCTYLEVLSCGVPIVGYANEAFQGIIRRSDVGWSVPMNRPERLAALVATLDADRASMATASKRALEFARQHTFERTFRARVEHLEACAAEASGRPHDRHPRSAQV